MTSTSDPIDWTDLDSIDTDELSEDDLVEYFIQIRRACSRKRASQTDEENEKEGREAMEWFRSLKVPEMSKEDEIMIFGDWSENEDQD